MKFFVKFFVAVALLAGQKVFSQSDEAQDEFQPKNPPAIKPLAGLDTPAHRTAKLFLRGVNLGDHLEAPRKWGGVEVRAEEFTRMKEEGFDHVRVPVGWHQYCGPGPEYKLEPEIFERVDFAVSNALKNKLAVMINLHHFRRMDTNPAAATAQFSAIWRQVAAHYRDYPDTLVFELLNEPHNQATTALMNPIYARVIAEIRETNPRRTLVAEPGGWGSVSELNNLVLPPDDNLLVSVHCYEPFFFTHQGASWTGADFRQTGIIFPGPPCEPLKPDLKLEPKPWVLQRLEKYNSLPAEKNPSSASAFTGKLQFIRAWSEHYGRPVYLGEFGAIIKADSASRARFYSAFRHAAETNGIGWCIWDWSANFRYWDKAANAPQPGMREALFDPAL